MTRKTKKENKKLEQAGALWLRESKNGVDYLTGKDSEGNKLIAFFNDNPKSDKEPHIRIYFQEDE